jgi:hypothetical protein
MRIYEITLHDEKSGNTEMIQVSNVSFESAMSEVYSKKIGLNHSTQSVYRIVKVVDMSYTPRR